MVENKTSLQGLLLFSQSLFISRFLVCLFFGFFFYFVSVFNCQHCSVHKKFCKEEKKTCSVVSTLNMSLANKRFSV